MKRERKGRESEKIMTRDVLVRQPYHITAARQHGSTATRQHGSLPYFFWFQFLESFLFLSTFI